MTPQPETARQAHGFHAVRFFDGGDSLTALVARFITSGLVDGDPGIIIATGHHRTGILHAIEASVDIKPLLERGELIVLDAEEALGTFMVDGMPDVRLFEQGFLGLIDKASARRRDGLVRVYGEMVDVLWKQGQHDAALRVEGLGNQLMRTRKLSILCGYSMDNAYEDGAFQSICCVHSHVMSVNGVPVEIGPGGAI